MFGEVAHDLGNGFDVSIKLFLCVEERDVGCGSFWLCGITVGYVPKSGGIRNCEVCLCYRLKCSQSVKDFGK